MVEPFPFKLHSVELCIHVHVQARYIISSCMVLSIARFYSYKHGQPHPGNSLVPRPMDTAVADR